MYTKVTELLSNFATQCCQRHWLFVVLVTLAIGVSHASSGAASEAKISVLKPSQSGDRDLPVRGVVRSSHEAKISTDLSARITEIAFKEGERFSHHDLLIRLDCRRYKAEWEAAKALEREMSLSLKSAEFLYSQKTGSNYKVETARARLDRAIADARAVASRADQCEFRAPFDGRVAKLHVHEHETPQVGRPMISILSDRDLSLELIVPSSWLSWLEKGTRFEFVIDETQTTHQSEIKRIAANVDSVSQTIKVYANFTDKVLNILPGMSGTATFAR